MPSKMLFPILNKKSVFFKGPTCSFSSEISLQSISHEDLGLIHKHVPEEYSSVLPKDFKCIVCENYAGDDKYTSDLAVILSFLFNFFKDESPISLAFGVQTTTGKKQKYEKTIPLNYSYNVISHRSNNYKVKAGNNIVTVSNFFELICRVYEKYPSIILTISRFNSALYRTDTFDKIVDITVALESLINGMTELSYRFALYNSMLSEKDETKRKDTYDLLKLLYNSRSTIVHGSDFDPRKYKKTIEPIQQKWDSIVNIAQRAIAYHLLFLDARSIDEWFQHQESLALGTVTRYL